MKPVVIDLSPFVLIYQSVCLCIVSLIVSSFSLSAMLTLNISVHLFGYTCSTIHLCLYSIGQYLPLRFCEKIIACICLCQDKSPFWESKGTRDVSPKIHCYRFFHIYDNRHMKLMLFPFLFPFQNKTYKKEITLVHRAIYKYIELYLKHSFLSAK